MLLSKENTGNYCLETDYHWYVVFRDECCVCSHVNYVSDQTLYIPDAIGSPPDAVAIGRGRRQLVVCSQ